MMLNRIRLVLARTPEFPAGSSRHGYEFVAPLTKEGHIDADAWKHAKDKCRVIRFWGDEPEQQGWLRHVGTGWRFDYAEDDDADDEPFFKLERHEISPGAYVSITEQDHVQRPFKIISVIPVGEKA